MTSGIYKIINKIDNRYYLGSSQNIERRWIRHKYDLKRQKHNNIFLQRAYNKYGSDAFYLEIINICQGEIKKIEQDYLDKLDDFAYNLSKFANGGDMITYHPDRSRILNNISKSLKKRYSIAIERQKVSISNSGHNNPMWGKLHSNETKNKISIKIKEWFSKNLSYRKGKRFENIFEKELSDHLKNILSECAKQRVGNKNPFFGKSHSKESKEKISKSRKGKYFGKQNTPILINEVLYSSLGEASKILNIPIATIRFRVLSNNFINYKYVEEIL